MPILTDRDSGVGENSSAAVELGGDVNLVDIHAETSGDATLTVEVRTDGDSDWLVYDEVSYTGATVQVEQYECAFRHLRAYLDSNRVGVTVSAKA